eukprot:evm.model.NODE_29797_length_44057_cov_23.302427.2
MYKKAPHIVASARNVLQGSTTIVPAPDDVLGTSSAAPGAKLGAEVEGVTTRSGVGAVMQG